MPEGKRVVWIVLDAAGYELTRRCLEAGIRPSLSVMARKGCRGPTAPPEPNCQTPPALLSLTGKPPRSACRAPPSACGSRKAG